MKVDTTTHGPHRAEAGFTLVEVLVAAAFLATLLLAGVRMTLVTSDVASATVFQADLDARAHRIMERLAGEFQSARRESLTPDAAAPFGTATLTYERAETDGAGVIAWSSSRRLLLIPSPSDPLDGTDNNMNGLVDEHEIWLAWDVGTPDEFRSQIAGKVAPYLDGETANALDDNGNGLVDERGLSLELRDDLLLIRVSLQGVNPEGDVETRTAETAIRVRN